MKKDSKAERSSMLKLIASMAIFGTIGIFRKFIPLPSAMLAMSRGFIGMLFLLLVTAVGKRRISASAVRKNILALCVSGVFIGLNWILLFEAYNYTTVATATLCYYMAPIFVILASPFLLRERLTAKKGICVALALIGMIFVSGILEAEAGGVRELKGILLGLGAALLYASVVMLNKKISDISAYDRTIVQLFAATVVIAPYALLSGDLSSITCTPGELILILAVGVIHTGVAYALYFGSMDALKAQTIAISSYIDPVVAIFLSALFLKESMAPIEIAGAVLVLGSTLFSELPVGEKGGARRRTEAS